MYSKPKVTLFLLSILGVLIILYKVFLAAPVGFHPNTVVSIEKGETLSGAASVASKAQVIRHRIFFKSFMILFGGTHGLVAGDYYFAKPVDVLLVAWRMSHGLYHLPDVRVTVPEGFSSKDIVLLFSKDKRFTRFKSDEFLKIASPHEGYLFPDTYLFLPSVTAQEVVDTMLKNYEKRIVGLNADIQAFKRPIKDVIKMASIVEEEARTVESREIIAGILWKRLDQGMALQVDSAFAFVNGKKDSKDLTKEDLKIASPYNTYVNKGLPPTPISNPGLAAIRDTVHPIKTQYYFYLSDDKGEMHYGVTLDEHLANKQKYLNY